MAITSGQAIAAAKRSRARAMDGGPVRVELPAWELEDGSPFVCYVTPVTLAEGDSIRSAVRRGVAEGRDSGFETVLQTVIHRAKNQDGSRIFSAVDDLELRGSLQDELIELAERITSATAISTGEILGNSQTPSSGSD